MAKNASRIALRQPILLPRSTARVPVLSKNLCEYSSPDAEARYEDDDDTAKTTPMRIRRVHQVAMIGAELESPAVMRA